MFEQRYPFILFAISTLIVMPPLTHAAEGKLQEATGVIQAEGSGGGGLVPWAVIAGGGSRDETAAAVFSSRLSLDDYQLNVWGAAVGIYDRIELSAAHQTFDLGELAGEISQNVIGVKVRLYGDVIYSEAPEIAAGLQYKTLLDTDIATAMDADDTKSGEDFYFALSKAHLGALFGHNLFWDLTVRATQANQFGLLGYGGDKNTSYQAMLEGSMAVFVQRSLAVGMEYRQKPDNLSYAEEQDAADLFVAYIPNKHYRLIAGWADLGNIAGAENQQGLYLSLAAHVW